MFIRLNHNNLDELPCRSSFIEPTILENKLYILPCDVHDFHVWKYGKKKTVINVFGALPNGEKIYLKIMNPPIFFDIDWTENSEQLLIYMKNDDSFRDIKFKCSKITGKHFMYYEKDPVEFIRIFTDTTQERRKLIDEMERRDIKTYSNDTSKYYRKFTRENGINLANWIKVKKYNIIKTTPFPFIECEYENMESVIKNTITPSAKELKELKDKCPNDKLLLITFDIETYTPELDMEVPEIEFKKDENKIFMIGLTLHWKDSKTSLCRICICTQEIKYMQFDDDDLEDWIFIKCDDEISLLQSFITVLKKFQPDIITGFNDMAFDWPFIIYRMDKFNLLPEFYNISPIAKKFPGLQGFWRFSINKSLKVKISAEREHAVFYPIIPGMVPLDVRVAFMKLMPRSERTNLNFFLKKMGLQSKLDVAAFEMFKYFRENNAKMMYKVAKYCLVDAFRCQELLIKRGLLQEYKNIASISYTSFFDAIMYANGSKVCNLVWHNAIKHNYICSNRTNEKQSIQYPGGYVFPPVKGIERDIPIVGLDFASLYPSLIMTYNFSPEKFIATAQKAAKYETTNVNFGSSLGSIIGWFVKHKNKEEDIGIFPSILIELFKTRKVLKKQLVELKNKIEKHIQNKEFEKADQLEFDRNLIDSRQLAIKVYMNTFYGETGNTISPLFLLPLAGGITTKGQQNIKFVRDIVESKNFIVKYGDTDSVYVGCNPKTFKDIIEKYEENPNSETYLQACSDKVMRTKQIVKSLLEEINAKLIADNGSHYLRLDYEEVLYPVVFLGKKKYFGIPHHEIPAFSDYQPFLRGIEIVKQGQAEISKKIGKKIISESLRLIEPHKHRPQMVEIVEQVIADSIQSKEWRIEDFEIVATYKPHKKCISNNKFMERMKIMKKQEIDDGVPFQNRIYNIPEPNEKFRFIIVKKQTQYNIKGCKIIQQTSDKMEFSNVVKNKNIQWDIEYYLIHYVAGICARFINYQFEGKNDIEMQSNAKKYIERKIKEYFIEENESTKYKKLYSSYMKQNKETKIGKLLVTYFEKYQMQKFKPELLVNTAKNLMIRRKYYDFENVYRELISQNRNIKKWIRWLSGENRSRWSEKYYHAHPHLQGVFRERAPDKLYEHFDELMIDCAHEIIENVELLELYGDFEKIRKSILLHREGNPIKLNIDSATIEITLYIALKHEELIQLAMEQARVETFITYLKTKLA